MCQLQNLSQYQITENPKPLQYDLHTRAGEVQGTLQHFPRQRLNSHINQFSGLVKNLFLAVDFRFNLNSTSFAQPSKYRII